MNFTGERVIPGEVDADLFNEHWARYLFAARYAAGKRVLDVACGSGYGSALLTKDAARVAGVDISREAVEYASRHYGSAKILFAQADCYSLPFVSAQFDLVVAFEIIEHLTDAASFLQEARRVLAPAGLLLISTPNRLYYTEDRGEVNPFHEREFSYPEFADVLGGIFPHCSILLENHVAGLLVADSSQAGNLMKNPPACQQQDTDQNPAAAQQREQEAYYLVAICSAQPLAAAAPLLYLPSTGNVLRERETHIRQLEQHLEKAQQERDTARTQFHQMEATLGQELDTARTQFHQMEATLGQELEESHRWAKTLDQKLSEKGAYILELQADYDLKLQWAQDLQHEVEKARSELHKLQREFEERTAWALRLNRDLEFLYNTRWYRIGRKLRMDLNPPASPPDGKS